MKAISLLLLTAAISFSQVAPLRKVGEKVVDLSLVYQELRKPSAPDAWHWKYVASGRVEASGPGWVRLYQSRVQYEYRGNGNAVLYGDSSDLLGMLAAAQIGSRGPISAGQLMAMSPALRAHYEPVEVRTTMEVTNYHRPVSRGTEMTLVALPTSVGNFNYGEPVPAVGEAPSVLTVGPFGITATPTASSSTIMDAERNAFAAQLKAATNGSPSAQYEVAKRFLEGRGTETNLLLATHWLLAAQTNGYGAAAGRLLEQVRNPRRSVR